MMHRVHSSFYGYSIIMMVYTGTFYRYIVLAALDMINLMPIYSGLNTNIFLPINYADTISDILISAPVT